MIPASSHRKQRLRGRLGLAIAAGLVLPILGACDGVPGGDGGSGGSQIVLQPSDVQLFATSDALATVRDVEVLGDGSVWVLNSVEPFFVGFRPDGGALPEHGRRGGGPGEFGAPAGFVVGGLAGEAWVFDWERHAMIEVSRPDSARAEIPLPRETIPPGSVTAGMDLLSNLVRTGHLRDELILPRRGGEAPSDVFTYWHSSWGADLVALNPGTDSVRTVLALADLLGDPMDHVELGEGLIPFPLWYRLWAVCAERELRVYDRLRNELRRFSREGTELRAIPLPPPRFTEVTPRQFARATFDLAVVEGAGAVDGGIFEMSAADSARILDRSVQRLEATPGQLADLLPRYVDFRCADDGTHWLRPLDLESGGLRGGPLWLRIEPDGETREVRFPHRFDPYRFTSDRAWGVQRSELDVASVAWVALPPAR